MPGFLGTAFSPFLGFFFPFVFFLLGLTCGMMFELVEPHTRLKKSSKVPTPGVSPGSKPLRMGYKGTRRRFFNPSTGDYCVVFEKSSYFN
jgi:hypothetical protein